MEKTVFEWDSDKNEINILKHGISFNQAEKAFLDPNLIILQDEAHSKSEKRYFCLGKVDNEIMTVRFVYKAHIIRIFGAGYWRKGRKIYEEKDSVHR